MSLSDREGQWDRERWNGKFDEKGMESFGEEPSGWLIQHESLLRELSDRRALDLACGNGRNAFYLAELGFETDALDISDRAVEWTSKKAGERNLNIRVRRVDLESEPIEVGAYHAITQFNFLCRPLFPRLEAALAPGGLLLLETFSIDHQEMLGHEKNRSYLLEHNELLRAFPSLRVIAFRETVINEGPSGSRKGVASLVARKEI